MATLLIEPVARLIESFGRLPGIGPKTAQRLTYHLLRAPDAEARALAAALIPVFAEPMMRATYGEAYVSGTIALQILVWAYVLEFFNPFLSRVLYAVGRERSVLKAVIVGTAANIGLNILLIPTYSLTGAAVATLVSAGLIFVILWLSVFPIFREVSVSALAIRPALAGLSMWGVCTLLAGITPTVVALIGGFVYIACLVLTKAFSPGELLAVRRAVRTVTG